MHSAKCLQQTLPQSTKRMADKLEVPIEPLVAMSRLQCRQQVRRAVEQLRQVQYQASEKRQEWLERIAEDVARAAGVPDWRKHLEKMLQDEKERETNRKLTAIIKGPHQSLNWIEVPEGTWFYSRTNKELYHYDRGVFEAHAAWSPQPGLIPDCPWKFYGHHHLKVPHDDIVLAQVSIENEFIILRAVHQPSQIWRTVTDPKEIERLLLERNMRHLQQASIEEGRVHHPIMQRIMTNHGTDLLQEVLDGTITIPEATDEVVVAWITAVKQTDRERDLPPITGYISPRDFQEAFAKVSEHTSSSPSGINYTIWKCLARDEDLAGWLSTMMSLPFQHGFVNDRWTHSIDVMLEKKPGNRKIHMLRIIGLLEADFNTALKIIFAKKMMANAELAGLNNEQWGSRARRMALDPAMRNMMSFEYGRYMRATIAMFAADLTACFDRMFPAISNITAGKFGVDVNILRARAKVIYALKRAVRTGNGVSTQTYCQVAEDALIAGECQGKGDVALLYAILSSIIFDAHAKLYGGMTLPGATPGPGISKRNDGYVDDVNTWAGMLRRDLDTVEQVTYQLQKGSQSLTDLNETSGGSTAFHKCAVQLLRWKQGRRTLEINYDMDYPGIRLVDAKNAPSEIAKLRPNEANKGLGYHLAIDADPTTDLRFRTGKISHTCNGAQSARLAYREAYSLLNCRLLSQTKYGLHLSQYSKKMCQPLTIMINRTFLPLLHVHRKMPREVVFGPIDLGGLCLNTDIYNLQAQCAITYLVRTLRWDHIVAKDIIATLNACQLASGFETPLLEGTHVPISYLGRGWILNLRSMLEYFGMQVWIEDAWRFQKQRLGDRSIMETFASDPLISRTELVLTNELCKWWHVIFLSELASVDGKTIPYDRIRNGSEWRAIPLSGFNWPNTITPTDEHRAAFRKCLRLTVCPHMSPYTRDDYKLLHQLGSWYPVDRHIEYSCYRTENCILYRDEMGLHECLGQGTSGFFLISSEEFSGDIPRQSYPIVPVKASHDSLWTKRPYRPAPTATERNTIEIIRDDMPRTEISHVDIVSDAAVHVDRMKGAICWHAVDNNGNRLSASKPIEVPPKSYSYRHELLGIYDGLKFTLESRPNIKSATCHCDNKSGIDKIILPIHSPGDLMRPDMDIVMAIKAYVSENKLDVGFEHVKGHADKDKPREACTELEQVNIDCDEGAEARVQSGDCPSKFKPLPGSKCMVRYGSKWITSRIDKAIQYHTTSEQMEKYLAKRLGVPMGVIRDIDRDALGIARSSHRWHRIVRTSKMLVGWLPVGHNWRHHGATTDKCPCCGRRDETFDHLFRCESSTLVALRRELLKDMSRVASAERLPPEVITLAIFILRSSQTSEYSTPNLQPVMDQVWRSQQRIGLNHFITGYVSREWGKAMAKFGSKDPTGDVAKLITIMWDGWCEPIWNTRNNVLKKQPNPAQLTEVKRVKDRILWFKAHSNETLPPRYQFLTEFEKSDLKCWSRKTSRAHLKHLELGYRIYKLECRQRASGQMVMTDWLQSNNSENVCL